MSFSRQFFRIALISAVYILGPAILRVPVLADTVSGKTSPGTEIICTTTALGSVLNVVGGTNLNVHIFTPFGMCPGHFDLSPGEAAKLREADLLFFHGFELFLKGIDLKKGARPVQVEVHGNWMNPEIYKNAVIETERILSGYFPEQRWTFAMNRDRYIGAIDEAILKFDECIARFAGTKVVCSEMNQDFVERMGLTVVATFPRDGNISLKVMSKTVQAGRDGGVKLVIDNIQSSGKTGRTIAAELGVPLVMLSNFPRSGSGAEYWYIETLLESCSEIARNLP